jgi:hypothetical protein
VPWRIDVRRIAVEGWMGRAPLPAGTVRVRGRQINAQLPWEDPDGGCPGGWYRSRFVDSVRPFLRMRAEGGSRVSNPFFDRCEDDLVLQLVMYLEQEQEAYEAWAWEQVTSDV